jgi:hypothetical protein
MVRRRFSAVSNRETSYSSSFETRPSGRSSGLGLTDEKYSMASLGPVLLILAAFIAGNFVAVNLQFFGYGLTWR